MSKELVVSASRHETRIAILEDDTVVEIFYQREKEYSLAGSIHKGKVTRVLPGMQSAFVDIGLERDAFLYVSDFFEDNEEYDKVVTSVEEKVLKLDKTPQAVVEIPAIAEDETVEAEAEGAVVDEPEAPVVIEGSAGPVEVRQEREPRESRDSRDSRERGSRGRGRRGRRRRGGAPTGLPESKFYSPRRGDAETAAEPSNDVEPPVEADEEEFPVLPGESLAKYSAPDTESETDSEPEFEREPEVVDREDPVSVAPVPEPELERQPEPEREPEPAPEPQREPEPEPEQEPIKIEVVHEKTELREPPPVPEHLTLEPPVETPPDAPVIPPTEAAETEAGVDEVGEVEAADAESTEVIEEDEGPEPARIPTSLTAALREQGNRFPHRLSRRARRKMRGGSGGYQGDRNAPPVEPGAEAVAPPSVDDIPTVPAPEPAPRRERGERGERRERGERGERERSDRPERAPRAERFERNADRGERERTTPSITELLREGQEIIVQIAKEPLGQKGARITSHIALPGRFLVYMPTVDHVGVSRKIPSDEERQRLKRILQTNRAGMTGGFIVRTAGEGKSEEELRADMHFLYNLWLDIRQKAEKKPAPLLLHHDLDLVQRILRDQLTSSFKTIWVDNEEVFEGVLRFVQRFQPALVNRVKLYTRSNPLFDEFNVTSELEKALRPKVWLKSGGYIVINQTEALVAIDVNTGKYVGKSNRLEDTIVRVNTDAIKEIVRQIRLRDLGGIIVVDFIDMDERKNRQKVMQALEEAMRADRAPYKILAFNDFGLVAITRKRVKQSLERTLCSPCPSCEGAGYIKSAQTVVGEILQEAQKMAKVLEGNDVLLRVNPEVAKLLKSNRNDFLQELEETLGRTVMVKSDPTLHQTKFDLA
jgi:ribonuclease G